MESTSSRSVAVPAYLRKGLEIIRAGEHGKTQYLVKEKFSGKVHTFGEEEFFLLEVLPGFDDFDKLAGAYQDRFGEALGEERAEELFTRVNTMGLFGIEAGRHTLLAPFVDDEPVRGRIRRWRERAAKDRPAGAAGTRAGAGVDVAGIKEVLGIDDGLKVPQWRAFNPTRMFKAARSAIYPLWRVVYLVPPLLLCALFVVVNHFDLLLSDFAYAVGSYGFIAHAIFGLFTINLCAVMVQSFIGFNYRATIKSISVVLLLFFLPRFVPEMSHVFQMSRRERLWLHGSPLLVRLGLAAVGILLWFMTRPAEGFVQFFALSLFIIGLISFLVTVNPLMKSAGYHLLAVWLNEPMLRGKSYKALMNKAKGNRFSEVSSTALSAYALLSLLFTIVFLGVVLFFLLGALKVEIGAASYVVMGCLLAVLVYNASRKLKEAQAAYERSIQIERWKRKTLPEAVEGSGELHVKKIKSSGLKYGMLALFVLVLFLPYPYEPSGEFVILPLQQSQVASDIDGIIDEIYFNGGETLTKGTLVARLTTDDDRAMMAMYEARTREQEAMLQELLSRPKAEEIAVAEAQLASARTALATSRDEYQRFRDIYQNGAVSLQHYETIKRKHESDQGAVAEKEAMLELTRRGASPGEIAAAEAKVQRFREQRDLYRNKIERADLYMPIDGTLATLHLQTKRGKFLRMGEPLAVVENAQVVQAEIRIPEPDVKYIELGGKVRLKAHSYAGETFTGVVKKIDAGVSGENRGGTVSVITELDNRAGKLKSGMTGYAKTDGAELPVWKAFTRPIVRFVEVEMWSWIP